MSKARELTKLFGIPLLPNRAISASLAQIYGVGQQKAKVICAKMGLNPLSKNSDVMESVPALRRHIERHHVTGPDLVKRTGARIAQLIRMNCYTGIRHSMGLPVHGQKTRTRAVTQAKLAPWRASFFNYQMKKTHARKAKKVMAEAGGKGH